MDDFSGSYPVIKFTKDNTGPPSIGAVMLDRNWVIRLTGLYHQEFLFSFGTSYFEIFSFAPLVSFLIHV